MYDGWFNLTRTQCRDIEPCTGTMRANSSEGAICVYRQGSCAYARGRGVAAIAGRVAPKQGGRFECALGWCDDPRLSVTDCEQARFGNGDDRLAIRVAATAVVDERATRVLPVHDLHLYAVRLLLEERRNRRRSLVRRTAARLVREAHRTDSLADLWRRRVRLLADAPVDVAVGGGICGANCDRHAGVERARSARRGLAGRQPRRRRYSWSRRSRCGVRVHDSGRSPP